jgi:bifunctional DNA-binding transcriptional regulator/antitoxin component of YhaV-PrlF toxin-antitoxin module
MTSRKSSQKGVRNLQKIKSTYYVSLPVELVRSFGWKEKQKVVVKKKGKNLIISDWTKNN